VHGAPTCAGSEKGSDHFRSYIRSLLLHFCKRLFSRLEHIIIRQQLYRCTSAPPSSAVHSHTKYAEMYRHYVPTKSCCLHAPTTLLYNMHQAYYTNRNTCLDPRSQSKVVPVTKLLSSVWYNLSHKPYQTV
jgi:hypothetical protein